MTNHVELKHVGLSNETEAYLDGSRVDPAASQALRNHSPDGFSWGYGGSGPAQLALGLLLAAGVEHEVAQRHYQDFKWEYLSGLEMAKDAEFDVDLRAWVADHERAAAV